MTGDFGKRNLIRDSLGKKVDIESIRGRTLSGYIMDYTDKEDSAIEEDSFTLFPFGEKNIYEFAISEIKDIEVDDSFRTIDIMTGEFLD